jgi:predicted DsbA family dithiol-disulfide isomerase
MSDTPSHRFFFDYVDPISYLVELELREAEKRLGARVERVPFELRAPPAPMLDPDDPGWRARWDEARTRADRIGIELALPPLVPWTHKAHELVLHAAEHEMGPQAHELLFDQVVRHGADVGRIDVLVRLAGELGLDETEAKAVLDVDRHAEAVVRARRVGMGLGIVAPPSLTRGEATLEGFRYAPEIVKFFGPF